MKSSPKPRCEYTPKGALPWHVSFKGVLTLTGTQGCKRRHVQTVLIGQHRYAGRPVPGLDECIPLQASTLVMALTAEHWALGEGFEHTAEAHSAKHLHAAPPAACVQ